MLYTKQFMKSGLTDNLAVVSSCGLYKGEGYGHIVMTVASVKYQEQQISERQARRVDERVTSRKRCCQLSQIFFPRSLSNMLHYRCQQERLQKTCQRLKHCGFVRFLLFSFYQE
jgi:hypothetical protein